ncbi:DUF3606 domain-containing protein [Pedobacter xixiisoli]|uniref:DUF3606 domain-containing protein n=1 Tax=Pedobacter xixiisoli TaxID=1476464 RepID=A0A285ZWG9_9SPHI|nr:DUF3606 domain-containing protein [Pedobacter xixiisoli]SOD13984.1 Protein of unknown function [Pedobacter xixiisoli]
MLQEENEYNKKDEVPDPEEFRYLHPIEDDGDTLEPFDDETENRQINAEDPADMLHWAQQFQISGEELKMAITINGTSVRDIKRFLSG